ncbi:MAG: DUF3368 domain-containing protein [Kiritimatiellae bacterium]|jgi:predicted nucleic acid-binding protein|nr:DUF3368 domain-containing protein [Kiritimatiellia bacterium]
MSSRCNKHQLVITDTGPLIALAISGYLRFLSFLFDEIIVPETVKKELCLEQDLPGVVMLREVLHDNPVFRVVSASNMDMELAKLLDPGEAEAISLAREYHGVLLIDERKGRNVAFKRGIPVVGTGRILIAAKQRGFLNSVEQALKELRISGYRLSDSLCEELVRLAGE